MIQDINLMPAQYIAEQFSIPVSAITDSDYSSHVLYMVTLLTLQRDIIMIFDVVQ